MNKEDFTMYPKEELIDMIESLKQENDYLRSQLEDYIKDSGSNE